MTVSQCFRENIRFQDIPGTVWTTLHDPIILGRGREKVEKDTGQGLDLTR